MAALSHISAFLDAASASSALAATVETRVVGDDGGGAPTGGLAVFYANCQGSGLAHWLRRSARFAARYPRCVVIPAHDLVDRRAPAFTDAQAAALADCDLLVHQPIADRHGPFATTAVVARLKAGAQTVSFAYLYDEAYFPLFPERSGVNARGAAAVRRYVDAAAAARPETPRAAVACEIRAALARGAVDGDALFDLAARTRDTLATLRAREAECDVRCADFVASRGASDTLFLTQNHPASPLLRFCADAALARLGLPPLAPDEAACDDANAARIPGRVWPRTVYDARGAVPDAAPPVPDFYLALFDRVVLRDLAAADGGVPDAFQ